MELIHAFEEVCGETIPYRIEARRDGDIVSMYANTDLAQRELNWKTRYNLKQMCKLRFRGTVVCCFRNKTVTEVSTNSFIIRFR